MLTEKKAFLLPKQEMLQVLLRRHATSATVSMAIELGEWGGWSIYSPQLTTRQF